jgi:hypothetical protein
MTWLARVLTKYSAPAEADLHREYGLELAGFWLGEYSPRYLAVRLQNLPNGSALWKMMADDRAWTQADYLLALMVEKVTGKQVTRPADVKQASVKEIKEQARAARWAARHGDGR